MRADEWWEIFLNSSHVEVVEPSVRDWQNVHRTDNNFVLSVQMTVYIFRESCHSYAFVDWQRFVIQTDNT